MPLEQVFDLASINSLPFTEFGYGEAREEIGWIKGMNNASNEFVKISMSGKKRTGIQTSRIITLLSIGVWKQVNLLKMICLFSSNGIQLTDENDQVIDPVIDWNSEEWNPDVLSAKFNLENTESGDYTILTTGGVELQLDFTFDPNEYYIEDGYESRCSDETDLSTQDALFSVFNNLASKLSSIAWGQGSSADLELPFLHPHKMITRLSPLLKLEPEMRLK